MDERKKKVITKAISKAYDEMFEYQITEPEYADDYITQAGIIGWIMNDDETEEDITVDEIREVIGSLISSHKAALLTKEPSFYLVGGS